MGERLFHALFRGFQDRGDGGLLYVHGEEYAYLFPHELPGMDDESKENLHDMITDDETGKDLFYVATVDDTDRAKPSMHLLAYDRAMVAQTVARSIEHLGTDADAAAGSSQLAGCPADASTATEVVTTEPVVTEVVTAESGVAAPSEKVVVHIEATEGNATVHIAANDAEVMEEGAATRSGVPN